MNNLIYNELTRIHNLCFLQKNTYFYNNLYSHQYPGVYPAFLTVSQNSIVRLLTFFCTKFYTFLGSFINSIIFKNCKYNFRFICFNYF